MGHRRRPARRGALRQVFAELDTVTARDTVSFHDYVELCDQAGMPFDPTAPHAAAKPEQNQGV
jgi:hypothetical protein